eukprot:GILJ01006866.1.p1 GENE.GILJ01006866.1~~GILJ01006866.1.p1  ORF type:complete len:1354 (+),score=235.07 GILJ01006866.1:130-4062(+)
MEHKANTSTSSNLFFVLNGEDVHVTNADPRMSVAEYLRTVAGLTGTKIGCDEGGCGACTVVLSSVQVKQDVTTKSERVVNACLRPLCSIDGMEVTTIEGIGSSKKGLHPLQSKIAECNGSQCGFCTPGMVMNMYGLMLADGKPTSLQVEDRFDGNLCRCTGYRPILSAFKHFACDKQTVAGCCGDIEDLCNKKCEGEIAVSSHGADLSAAFKTYVASPPIVHIEKEGFHWYRPTSLSQVVSMLDRHREDVVGFVVGGTSKGVTKYYQPVKTDTPNVWIDTGALQELRGIKETADGLVFGSAVTLTELIDDLGTRFKQWKGDSRAKHFPNAVRMFKRIANVQVRSNGSWVGNLMLTKQHPEFASDFVPTIMALGVTLDVVDLSSNSVHHLNVREFLDADFALENKLVLSMSLPYGRSTERFAAYKVALRHVNSHAFVNAAFRMNLDQEGRIIESTMIFGGFNCLPVSVQKSSQYLINKIINQQVLTELFRCLESELIPFISKSATATEDVNYQMQVCLGYIYKFILSITPSLPPRLRSAATFYERPVTSAIQKFTPDISLAPVSLPIAKQTATIQATGQVKYTADINLPGSLHANYVMSTVPTGRIVSVDTTEALSMPGVVGFVSANDIPGVNDISTFMATQEPVFAKDEVHYHGQPLGLIVADSPLHARHAALKVRITYESTTAEPIITLQDAIVKQSVMADTADSTHTATVERGDISAEFDKCDFVIPFEDGIVRSCGQYHFYMETQTAVAVANPDGTFHIQSATQGPYVVQKALSKILKVNASKISVDTNHVGGGFGGKLTRCIPVAAAVAVAANRFNKPVHMQLDRNTDMTLQGKRDEFLTQYRVGFNRDGTIRALHMKTYVNGGYYNDSAIPICDLIQFNVDNSYCIPNWKSDIQCMRTNLPPTTAMRSPGEMDAMFISESIIEHVANYLNISADVVRLKNRIKEGDVTPYGQVMTNITLPRIRSVLDTQSGWDVRRIKVNRFNEQNRWRKRGIASNLVKYGIQWGDAKHGAIVNIYDADGTVMISHSGVEIGQGIHTKVCQAASYALGIPMEKIFINLSTSTDKVPNAQLTGSSTTSETCCQAVMRACEELLRRIDPIRKANPEASWEDTIAQASAAGVELQATGWFAPTNAPDGNKFMYYVYGEAVSEVEIDVLTGEVELLRTDIVYDCGTSLNPAIDIGQIEGAFAIGLGYVMTEYLDINGSTGRLENNGTWEYKPVFARDIPVEFNVTLLNDTPNPSGILRSKASAEPPVMLAFSVLFAIKNAIAAARQESGLNGPFNLDVPATPKRIQQACKVKSDQMTLY